MTKISNLTELREKNGEVPSVLARRAKTTTKKIRELEKKNSAQYNLYDQKIIKRIYELPEYAGLQTDDKKSHKTKKPNTTITESLTISKVIIAGFSALLVTAIIGYIVAQIITISLPPKIVITDPKHDISSQESQVITVSGSVEKANHVQINGTNILLNSDNEFTHTFGLFPGTNELIIEAISPFGVSKTQTLVVYVSEVPKTK